jgi:hypothetical protein
MWTDFYKALLKQHRVVSPYCFLLTAWTADVMAGWQTAALSHEAYSGKERDSVESHSSPHSGNKPQPTWLALGSPLGADCDISLSPSPFPSPQACWVQRPLWWHQAPTPILGGFLCDTEWCDLAGRSALRSSGGGRSSPRSHIPRDTTWGPHTRAIAKGEPQKCTNEKTSGFYFKGEKCRAWRL